MSNEENGTGQASSDGEGSRTGSACCLLIATLWSNVRVREDRHVAGVDPWESSGQLGSGQQLMRCSPNL